MNTHNDAFRTMVNRTPFLPDSYRKALIGLCEDHPEYRQEIEETLASYNKDMGALYDGALQQLLTFERRWHREDREAAERASDGNTFPLAA